MATQPAGHPVVRAFQRSAEAMKQLPDIPAAQACALCGGALSLGKQPKPAEQASQSEQSGHGGICARCLNDLDTGA